MRSRTMKLGFALGAAATFFASTASAEDAPRTKDEPVQSDVPGTPASGSSTSKPKAGTYHEGVYDTAPSTTTSSTFRLPFFASGR